MTVAKARFSKHSLATKNYLPASISALMGLSKGGRWAPISWRMVPFHGDILGEGKDMCLYVCIYSNSHTFSVRLLFFLFCMPLDHPSCAHMKIALFL